MCAAPDRRRNMVDIRWASSGVTDRAYARGHPSGAGDDLPNGLAAFGSGNGDRKGREETRRRISLTEKLQEYAAGRRYRFLGVLRIARWTRVQEEGETTVPPISFCLEEYVVVVVVSCWCPLPWAKYNGLALCRTTTWINLVVPGNICHQDTDHALFLVFWVSPVHLV